MIYVDNCLPELEEKIKGYLNEDIVKRMSLDNWNINECMAIITLPDLKLAIFNNIDEVTMMEISLLNFMCKKILITHKAIEEYPIVEKCIDFTDYQSNLMDPDSTFISWYRRQFWNS